MSIQARFTFKKDRASEFLFDGQEVTQIAVDNVAEVNTYCQEFGDALLDVNYIDEEGTVKNISDFSASV